MLVRKNETVFESSEAHFSKCLTYRFHLRRTWDSNRPPINFLMLNPSTADEMKNDPTIERCCRRAEMWFYGGVWITNLFALRSTDPAGLRSHPDPVGPGNDQAILDAAKGSAAVVCAWGNHGSFQGRGLAVFRLLEATKLVGPLFALDVTKTGHPAHPLYLGYDRRPMIFLGKILKGECQ